MAGLGAVLPGLLLLIGALWSPAEATADWDNPFLSADTSDDYIKDVDESNAVLTVYEDVPIGHKIAELNIVAQTGDPVVVTQQDKTDEIRFSFDGNITKQNVYIQSALDREKTDSITVSLLLNGGSQTFIAIDVADINDNTPTFDDQGSQISLDVPENQLNDSLLILTATDADPGATATLTYTMNTGGYDDVFKLTLTTKDNKPACQLRLLKQLDYETRPLYKLTITVKDTPDVRGTTFSSSVTVFVNVQDVGDSPPRWLQPPMASSVDENTNKGSELFTVQAIDGDTSVDNNITYSILT
ncbi:cadherin-related family member 1-like, partial [Amphibalanus amphitrite]|uniref:cadherin-related family member 1-like n=1 Tax=Amphibalanus amphitrite TaxID=1232801 RepID=UPI001C905ECB